MAAIYYDDTAAGAGTPGDLNDALNYWDNAGSTTPHGSVPSGTDTVSTTGTTSGFTANSVTCASFDLFGNPISGSTTWNCNVTNSLPNSIVGATFNGSLTTTIGSGTISATACNGPAIITGNQGAAVISNIICHSTANINGPSLTSSGGGNIHFYSTVTVSNCNDISLSTFDAATTFVNVNFNGSNTMTGTLNVSGGSNMNGDPGAIAVTSNGSHWFGSQSPTVTGTDDTWGTNGSMVGSYGGTGITNTGSGAIVYGGTFLVPYTQTGGAIHGGTFGGYTIFGATTDSSSTTFSVGFAFGTLQNCTVNDVVQGGANAVLFDSCTVNGCTIGSNCAFQGTVDVAGGSFSGTMGFQSITTHINFSNFSSPGAMNLHVTFPTQSVVEYTVPTGVVGGTNVAVGNNELPLVAWVQSGYQFGENGTQYTGTFVSGGGTTGYGG